MGMEMLGKQNPKLQTRFLWIVGMETCTYLTFLCRPQTHISTDISALAKKGHTHGNETDLGHPPRFIPHQLNDAGPSYLTSLRLHRSDNLTYLEEISGKTSIKCIFQSLAQSKHSPHATFLSLPSSFSVFFLSTKLAPPQFKPVQFST